MGSPDVLGVRLKSVYTFSSVRTAPAKPAADHRSNDDAGHQNKKHQEGQRQFEPACQKADGHRIRILAGKYENHHEEETSHEEFDVPPDDLS